MIASDRLSTIAGQLRDGKPVAPIAVREFLSWFDAQRRGYWIVHSIREALAQHDLRTDPDFESEYIDSLISFALQPPTPTTTTVPPSDGTSGLEGVLVSASAALAVNASLPYDDPTYRISKLGAANKPPVSVNPDATMSHAVTLMLSNDYSQLPVMTGERDLKGVISWTSIGTRLALGKDGAHVRDLMDQPQEIKADSSIFQAIPVIVQHQYVLVRGHDTRITGIVTASDLSLQFQQLAEPFLLLSEIENHIRRLIGGKFSVEELSESRDPSDGDRQIANVADMTFGGYIRLLEKPERWAKLQLSIDRATFCKQLDRVRMIRNDVMHFDPDGIPPVDLDALRDFTRFLQRLRYLGLP